MNERGNDPSVLDVLIVDDAPSVAASTAAVLQGEGMSVETAGTMAEAGTVLAGRTARCVILDHSIVDWDGGQCTGMSGAHPVVIVVSGLGREELAEVQRQHADDIFACLAKPVLPARLIEVVRSALDLT